MLVKIADNIKPLFGCDPEAEAVYLKDGKPFALPPYYFRNFLGVPAVDPVGDGRHPEFFKTDEFKAIEDGANFEMTILPSHNPKELFDRVQECAKQISDRILRPFPEHCLPDLQFLPTVGWDVERWKGMPEDFFMSTEFGCDPDEDALNMQAQAQVLDASLHPERYAGGHVHMSGSKMIEKDPILAVFCQTITSGLASVAYSDVIELENRRLFLYGRPCKFRVQVYGERNKFGPDYAVGIEYRTPSARWAGNWDVARHVLRWAEIGLKNLLETKLGTELTKKLLQPAVQAIMTSNQADALNILSYVESRI